MDMMGGVCHIMGGGTGDGAGHIMVCCGTEDGAGHSIMDGSGTEDCIGSEDEGSTEDEGGSEDEGSNQDEGGTPRSSSPWSCSLASLFFSRMASHLLLLISFEDGGGAEDEGGTEDKGGAEDKGFTEDESGTPRFPSPWS